MATGRHCSRRYSNLVGNAVKYAGADRWVRVRVSPGGTPSKREVRIAVDDHGPGLDADEQRQVFEPFFRGRDAVTNQIQGSGLGLSLVRRIVDAHGGRVELESAARPRQHLHHLPARRQFPAGTAAATSSLDAPGTAAASCLSLTWPPDACSWSKTSPACSSR